MMLSQQPKNFLKTSNLEYDRKGNGMEKGEQR